MKFTPLGVAGAYLIEPEPHQDERGYFSRVYCEDTFRENELWHYFPQHNHSYNKKRGTVRGMHYQTPPHEEVKLVSCPRGAVTDAIVDIRQESETYKSVVTVRLDETNGRAVYIPKGVAHGFQTHLDNTLVHYLMGAVYSPNAAAGFCWNDPAFDISWPEPVVAIAEKDLLFAPFSPQ